MTKRPQRKNKADRLVGGTHDANAIRCDYAIAPLDNAAKEMDAKWGVDRLPELVSPETAERYGAAMAHLNASIDSGDPAACVNAAANCMRGLAAMDAEATKLGVVPNRGLMEYDLDGFHFGVMADRHQWPAIQEQRPDLALFSMREVALALRAYCRTAPIAEVKKHFPNAEIKSLPDEKLPADFWKNGGDQIPF